MSTALIKGSIGGAWNPLRNIVRVFPLKVSFLFPALKSSLEVIRVFPLKVLFLFTALKSSLDTIRVFSFNKGAISISCVEEFSRYH